MTATRARAWWIAAWTVTVCGGFALLGILQEESSRVVYNATMAIGVLGTAAALLFRKAWHERNPQGPAAQRSAPPSSPWALALGTGSALAASVVLAAVLLAPALQPPVWMAVALFGLFMGSFYGGLAASALGLIQMRRGSRHVRTWATVVLGSSSVLLNLAVFVLAQR